MTRELSPPALRDLGFKRESRDEEKNWGSSILVFAPRTGGDRGSFHSWIRPVPEHWTDPYYGRLLIRGNFVKPGQGLGAAKANCREGGSGLMKGPALTW